MSICPYCDPKFYVIYGICRTCKRKGEAPLFDPESNMTYEEYKKLREDWYKKMEGIK